MKLLSPLALLIPFGVRYSALTLESGSTSAPYSPSPNDTSYAPEYIGSRKNTLEEAVKTEILSAFVYSTASSPTPTKTLILETSACSGIVILPLKYIQLIVPATL